MDVPSRLPPRQKAKLKTLEENRERTIENVIWE